MSTSIINIGDTVVFFKGSNKMEKVVLSLTDKKIRFSSYTRDTVFMKQIISVNGVDFDSSEFQSEKRKNFTKKDYKEYINSK